MKEKTIILPENLSQRRAILEQELRETVEVQTTEGLQEQLKDLLNQAGFTTGTATLSWKFQGEYDDEGGTDYWPTGYYLVVNGESVEMEEVTFEYTYKAYNGEMRTYEAELRDQVADMLCDDHSDLYKIYMTEVDVKLD